MFTLYNCIIILRQIINFIFFDYILNMNLDVYFTLNLDVEIFVDETTIKIFSCVKNEIANIIKM